MKRSEQPLKPMMFDPKIKYDQEIIIDVDVEEEQ